MARLIAHVTGNVFNKKVGSDKIDLTKFIVFHFEKQNGKTRRIESKVELWENDDTEIKLAAKNGKKVYLYGEYKVKPVYNSKRTEEVFVCNKVFVGK